MSLSKTLTPEEIVALIGNIGNRPDIREVQERQVKEIEALMQKYITALRDVSDFPHWECCSAIWHKGYDRQIKDFSKCDCYVNIADKALGI